MAVKSSGVLAGVEAAGWRELLRATFRGQPYPVVVFDDAIVPAASLWAGARTWLHAFRASGVRPGDRVVLAVDPSPAFLQVFIAAFWEGLTLVLVDSCHDIDVLIEEFDAVSAVSIRSGRYNFIADHSGIPSVGPSELREAIQPSVPDIRLLLASSGTSATPRWAALSDANIFSVLASHRPLLGIDRATVLSALPWRHAFGLIIDLLPALFGQCVIIRDAESGRNVNRLPELAERWAVDYCSMVPLVAERLSSTLRGSAFLESLRGGVIGGAPVSKSLAVVLSKTLLRAGYGQTEASPGIALGRPGIWNAGEMGQPVGCSVQLDAHGSLFFSGRNACCGFWDAGVFHRADPNRCVDTGDIAKFEGDRLIFCGRRSEEFKLSNGTWVRPQPLEAQLMSEIEGLSHVMVYPTRNGRLGLAVERSSPAGLDESALIPAMGKLGQWLESIVEVVPNDWIRTPKGDLNRALTARRLSESAIERKVASWST